MTYDSPYIYIYIFGASLKYGRSVEGIRRDVHVILASKKHEHLNTSYACYLLDKETWTAFI